MRSRVGRLPLLDLLEEVTHLALRLRQRQLFQLLDKECHLALHVGMTHPQHGARVAGAVAGKESIPEMVQDPVLPHLRVGIHRRDLRIRERAQLG